MAVGARSTSTPWVAPRRTARRQASTQVAAANREWEELVASVPKNLQAIELQIGNMKGKKAESAKTELDSMKAMWQEAAAAFTAGDAAAATDKGRAVQEKAKAAREQLGMTPA